MTLNVRIDFGVAREQLRSHQFSELFTQTLGWSTPKARLAPTQHSTGACVPIAERDQVIVWQVMLAPEAQLTHSLRHHIYTDLQQKSVAAADPSEAGRPSDLFPLAIFTTADRCRSLWCQSPLESALFVDKQPMALWMYRLRRLAKKSRALFPTVITESLDDKTLTALVDELYQGTDGIEFIADRRLYSVLTMQRLVFLQQLQQKGWLNGDTWYLQTRFGEALQQGRDLFFSQCLRSLYRSLSLPSLERPLVLQAAIGEVPFIGQLFHTHWLEEKYPSIAIRDQAFENLLGWLSEQTSSDRLNPWMTGDLGYWLEQHWRQQTGREPVEVGRPEIARNICDCALDQWVLNRLDISASSSQNPRSQSLHSQIRHPSDKTLNDFLFDASASDCRRLVQDILPELRILDPYCGGGTLLSAFHQRLTEIFSVLTGYIQQNEDSQLKIWQLAILESPKKGTEEETKERIGKGTTENNNAALKNIQEGILKNTLYGVAHLPEAAESAHFLLLMHLIATAQSAVDIEPLIELEFSVMSGNALVGFISVDEERFEQVNRSDGSRVLQGNLLQPLAADSYQTILDEKNIALEHYQSRSQMIAKSHTVPPYARAALLREEIMTLDSKAQRKLDTLLLSHMGQQLGIGYRETQLSAKPQRRLLSLQDVKALRPLHWGYHFSAVVQRGGFDVVACCPPWGSVKPTVSEFVQQHQDLAERQGVSEKTLKTSKQALAQADLTVAEAWLNYQDRYAYMVDYFYRSELYAHQNPIVDGKPVRNQLLREKLFAEQCFNLLSRGGCAAILLPEKTLQDAKSERLLQLLCESEGALCNQCEWVSFEADRSMALILSWLKPL